MTVSARRFNSIPIHLAVKPPSVHVADKNEAAGATDAAFVPYSSHMRREASKYRPLQHKALTHDLSIGSDSISID